MPRKTIKESEFNEPIEKHTTAAWANIEKMKPVSNVSVPSEFQITNAKDHVDANKK